MNVTFAILALALFAYFVTGQLRGSDVHDRPHEQAVTAADDSVASAATTVGSAVASPTATAGSAVASPVAVSDVRTLHVDAHATGECWLTATADGAQIAYRLMKPDEHETMQAQSDLVLRVGDPASLDLSLDGRPMRRLGRAGEAVTVKITLQNYREFLSP
jgi:cytoskeleton protein RodZ